VQAYALSRNAAIPPAALPELSTVVHKTVENVKPLVDKAFEWGLFFLFLENGRWMGVAGFPLFINSCGLRKTAKNRRFYALPRYGVWDRIGA
jgi:hypothetical protein